MKKEAVDRLTRLHDAINDALYYDDFSFCMPALYQAFIYMWGKSIDDTVNHNKKHTIAR